MKMTAYSMNIETVGFSAKLSNLKEFKQYWTDTFFIRGNPWVMHFEKIDSDAGDPKNSYLSCFLHSKIETPLKDWAIIANCTVEIYSNNYNGESVVKKFDPHFFFKLVGWGITELINWDELMDPERGYVYNDTCKIGIKVKASPLQFPNDGKMLEFVPVLKCCDSTSKGEFRIKINEVYNFFDMCSPEFTLKHFAWRFIICKNFTSKNDKKEEFLRVRLYNPSLADDTNLTCKVTLLCKLVPFGTAIEPISKKLENQEVKHRSPGCNLDIISWNELMNPQKKFIQNNSFVLQIIIEVTEPTEQENAKALKRAANDKNNQGFIRLECPICFKWLMDQPISSLSCGHMYCSACISSALQQKKICPLCLKESTEAELRKVHLPAK